MSMENKEKLLMKICPDHLENKTPLLWTFAFIGAEYWCHHCGYTAGMLGAGIDVDSTKELEEKLEKLKQSKEDGNIGEYLHAHGVTCCSETKFNDEWIKPEDLPQEEKDRLAKIREQDYPIEI